MVGRLLVVLASESSPAHRSRLPRHHPANVPRRGSARTPLVWARNGSKLATLSGNSDGSVFVSMVIDYGQHGTTFCDGASREARFTIPATDFWVIH